ncbi:unnamed protein product [Phytomonas sp. EM1]|nr:unnamed protein product [Phytomonas sp. EM1]|eukprot:CCW64654.1 unnamed protein product [Phytomonas sp. isolate EM1]
MSNPILSDHNGLIYKDQDLPLESLANPMRHGIPQSNSWGPEIQEDLNLEAESNSDSHFHYNPARDWRKKDDMAKIGKTPNAAALIERMLQYMKTDPPFPSPLKHVLAFINGESGEKNTSSIVHRSLITELGVEYVVLLSKDMFANPRSLRQRIKEQSVVYHPEKINVRERTLVGNVSQTYEDDEKSSSYRGTIVISGGDGTISFIMDQVQLVGEELEKEFGLEMRASSSEQWEVDSLTTCDHEECTMNTHHATGIQKQTPNRDKVSCEMSCHSLARELFTLPAIAVIPMGTGNDFSNCLGFGSGLKINDVSLCCYGCDSTVIKLLQEATSSECIAFDRWLAEFVPLEVAQRYLKRTPHSLSPVQANDERVFVRMTAMNETAATHAENAHEEMKEMSVNGCALSPTSSLVDSRPEHNAANLVHHIDWERVREDARYKSRNVTNYVSVGYDSYVTYQFDRFRRQHPWFCSTRTRNKMVYCAMGLKAGTKCKRLRRLVPAVCVPDPFAPAGRPEMVALRLPKHAKALLFSNVDCYSGGTRPWSSRGGLYYRPAELQKGNVRGAAPTTTPPVMPVSVNDGKFEVQAMGGVLDYGSLSVGITGATKIIQSGEAFAFVRCSPDDLRYPYQTPQSDLPSDVLSPTRANDDPSGSKESMPPKLWVQVDGEAVFPLTEPTIVHIRRMNQGRIYVRCRNPSLLSQLTTTKKP